MRIIQRTIVAGLSLTLVVASVSAAKASAAKASATKASGSGQVPTTQSGPDKAVETSKSLINEFFAEATLSEALVAQQKTVEDQPGDQNEKFRLGMMQFLRALEGLGQDHHRFGLMSGQRMTIPLMRLPVPPNENPEKLTYQKARSIVRRLLKRLTVAQQTLESINTDEAEIRVPVDLTQLALDLNNDGNYMDKESILYISAAVQRGRRTVTTAMPKSFPVMFDNADVSWLEGYTHVLSAFCEVALAHDWEKHFNTSAILFYPNVETPFDFLKDEPRESVMSFSTASIFDIVAFLHNINYECKYPKRMLAALEHLEAVVTCSRKTWSLIEAETDNEREWLPGPKQTSIMGSFRITQQIVGSWKDVTDEVEALLKGKKLAPFWRGTEGGRINGAQVWNKTIGINVRKMFTEPTGFDMALWIHGSGLQPYLEEGDISSPEDWRKFNRAFGNRFWNFAFWIN
ncbi:MAG: hypothetical protein ABJZ55_17425 [Fuerstiella sp.]